ncbi:Fe-Mn family superoxide dismutase [Patescibacteria group bacterium]|nr:Fe-Mn family superoxide dismutase [Patescibacteria group bacterium]
MYTAQKFTFNALDGISEKQLDVHIKLYEGYVKFLNTLESVQADLMKDSEKNAYALGEVTRRIGFEWNGMRMHEHYFSQWEGAPSPIGGKLAEALSAQYGSYDAWLAQFKGVSMMRGIGWAILSHDTKTNRFTNHFVADHELGQLNGLNTILALDMWEHAFMVDYVPAEKAKYVEAFFKNLNGASLEKRLA